MMTRISVISDRPDYSSVYVSDGCEIVERAGGPPWRTLFKAVLDLKIKQFKRKVHVKATEGKAIEQSSNANIFPLHRFDLSPSGSLLVVPTPIACNSGDGHGYRRVIRVDGQTVDQLRGAKPPKTVEGRTAPRGVEGDRPKAS